MSMSCGLNTASLDHQRWVGWPPVIGGGTGALRCLRAQFLNIPHPDHHHLPTSYTQKLHSFDSTHRDDSDEQILSEANQTQDVNTLLELQFLKVMAGSYLLIMFRYIEDFSATMTPLALLALWPVAPLVIVGSKRISRQSTPKDS